MTLSLSVYVFGSLSIFSLSLTISVSDFVSDFDSDFDSDPPSHSESYSEWLFLPLLLFLYLSIRLLLYVFLSSPNAYRQSAATMAVVWFKYQGSCLLRTE